MPGKKTYNLQILIDGKVDPSLLNATNLTKRQLKALTADLTGGNKKLAEATKRDFETMDRAYAQIEKKVLSAAKVVAAGGAAFTAYSVTVGSAFEAQMSTVEAVSNATAEDMAMLTAKAKEMGITTKFSATESGKAMEYMGMAGWDAQQMVSGLPGILDLAAASGEDLGAVSDIVTDDLTAFGYAANQAGRFADVLAATATSANTNVSLMGETFSYAAPLAGAMGYQVEDLALATGLMANASIKGSVAGTALRNLMTRMAKPTKESAEAMDALGLSLTDDEGKMKSFREILDDMRAGFSDLSEEQKAYYASELAGKQGLSGLLALVNATQEDYDKLAEAIDHSAGAAKRMATIRMDNLQGDVTLAKSAMEGLGIGIYDVVDGPLRQLVQMGTKGIQDIAATVTKNGPTIERELGDMAEGMAGFADKALDVGGFFLKNPKVLTTAFSGLATMMMSYKAISGMNALSGMLGTFKTLGPAAHATLGVVALAGAYATASAAYGAWYDNAKKHDLAEHFGDITLSAEELDKALRAAVDPGGAFAALDRAAEEIDVAASFKRNLDDAQKMIEKHKWKIGLGFELSESEQAEYDAAIESYISNANEYIKSHHYSITLGVKYLFGENDEAGQWQSEFDSAYGELEQELQHYSDLYAEAKKAYAAETSAGGAGISAGERTSLDAIFGEIMRITNTFETARSDAAYQTATSGRGLADADANSFQNFLDKGSDWLSAEAEAADEVNRTLHEGGNIAGFGTDQHNAIDAQTILTKANALARFVGDTASGTLASGNVYGEDIKQAQPIVVEAFNNALKQAEIDLSDESTIDYATVSNALMNLEVAASQSPLGAVRSGAIGDMYSEYSDSVDSLIQQAELLKEAYGSVPDSITDAISKAAQVGAAGGDIDAMYYVWAEHMQEEDSPGFQTMMAQAQELGKKLPEGLAQWLALNADTTKDAAGELPEQAAEGVEETSPEQMDRAAKQIHNDLQQALNREANSPLHYRPQILVDAQTGAAPIPHAAGGIFDTPHVGMVAEAGPEAIIPLSGGNGVSIWEQAGRMLGMGGGSPAISFSPQIIVQGNADQSVMQAAADNMFAQFQQMMDRYVKDNRRVALA